MLEYLRVLLCIPALEQVWSFLFAGGSASFAIMQQILWIAEQPQPAQRTREWMEFRHGIITASVAYKAVGTQAMKNQLIYEKCQPLPEYSDGPPEKMENTNSPMHWGKKYEPVSIQLYNHWFGTEVAEFGCIRHPRLSFLGASPDGIVVNPDSDRFGRMVEIKNPVSRTITGVAPSKYWIQMQVQMEVCNLDQCDYLETKFAELSSRAEYWADTSEHKGIIIQFHNPELNAPHYVYAPLRLNEADLSAWEEAQMAAHKQFPFIRFIYWKLETWSCVLVDRDRVWFASKEPEFVEIYNIIQRERVEGYQHRAPKKRVYSPTWLGGEEKGEGAGGVVVEKARKRRRKEVLQVIRIDTSDCGCLLMDPMEEGSSYE